MKKSNYVLLILTIFIAVTHYSCEKEKNLNNETKESVVTDNGPVADGEMEFRSDEFDYTQCPSIQSSVYKSGDMLVFQDMEHFEQCAICLENEYETYNDQYEAQYPDATPEELDALDSINNFNQWAPYLQFENNLNLSSLRAKIEGESELWLETTPAEEIDFADDPDSIPVFRQSIRALLNEDGFAKVGTDTISVNDWEEKGFWDECGFLTTQRFTFGEKEDPVLINRKIKMKIRVKSGLLNSNLVGEIKHYKKVGGKYKARRAKLKVQVTGAAFDGDCVLMPQGWNKPKGYKKRRNLQVNDYIWMLWREALVDRSDPRWVQERCIVHGYWESASNYYPIALYR
jgi:hypothetical protein